MVLHVLILWGVIAAAVALSLVIHRKSARDVDGDGAGDKDDDKLPNYSVVLGFVGSAYGLLLGLLVVFAVGHYSDARHKAQAEATSLVALYDTVAVYPPAVKDPYRRDLLCYMRSIVTDDWPSMERGTPTEAPRTLAFGDQVRQATRELPLSTDRERSAYGRAVSQITDASESRQQLLFFTEAEIPTPLWVVIYVGVFVFVGLIAVHYADHPRGRVIALGSVTLLLTVIVTVLTMLDRPFGPGVDVQPNEMRHAIALIANDNPAALRPCPAHPRDVGLEQR